MKDAELRGFREKMLSWFDIHRRAMPWREEKTPYRVWISEVMLQQTRVDTVIPYFERFMVTFPSLDQLAEASEDRLLKAWEGLGYYHRVRNLQKTARILRDKRGGVFPKTAAEWAELPGIGPYASGSIASIAFEDPVPAVDGNVSRVLARVEGLQTDLTDAASKNDIRSLAHRLVPPNRIGDFNQSLMELGALVCLPNGKPRCSECPILGFCEAFRTGRPESIPRAVRKAAVPVEERTVFVLDNGSGYAIQKRPAKGLLAGTWEFPHVEGHLPLSEAQVLLADWGFKVSRILPTEETVHRFSHRVWRMRGYRVQVEGSPERFIFSTLSEIGSEYALSTAFRPFQNQILSESPWIIPGGVDKVKQMNYNDNQGSENFPSSENPGKETL